MGHYVSVATAPFCSTLNLVPMYGLPDLKFMLCGGESHDIGSL